MKRSTLYSILGVFFLCYGIGQNIWGWETAEAVEYYTLGMICVCTWDILKALGK